MQQKPEVQANETVETRSDRGQSSEQQSACTDITTMLRKQIKCHAEEIANLRYACNMQADGCKANHDHWEQFHDKQMEAARQTAEHAEAELKSKIEQMKVAVKTAERSGSNERVKAKMEEKRIQIEQLQDEIARCKEAETTAVEAESRCEGTKEALQGRVILAEENLREAEQELQRVEEKCAQVTMLLE